jgi:hypothetical protein
MKVVITDYEYPDIERERSIVEAAGMTLEGYHVTKAEDVLKVASDADAIINQYADLNREVISRLEVRPASRPFSADFKESLPPWQRRVNFWGASPGIC